MPSDRQPDGRGSDDDERESYDEIAEDCLQGHDPGRWLDQPALDGNTGTSSPLLQARAVIRGLPTIRECRAWRAVERQLDRGPRPQVLEWIDERIDELEKNGERPPLGPDRDDWEPREIDPSGPSLSEDIGGGLSGRNSAEAQKLGTGRICQTPMSGSPPDGWTLPDGLDPIAPDPDGDDCDDHAGTDDPPDNTLAAAFGGDDP